MTTISGMPQLLLILCVQLVQATHVSLVCTIASKDENMRKTWKNKHPKQCKSEILYILYKEESIRIIKRPFLVSSSGQRDLTSHNLSKTKGHLPKGVQLDIRRCTEDVLQQCPLIVGHYTIFHRQLKEEQKYSSYHPSCG